jgi:type III secretion protein V
MAIDAELRAGAIDTAEARRRRRVLARESQFYGAMDGAMKFVKGDVVAGLVITAINILGGLAVGVLQRDMSAGDALRRYGLLTIGDGLVTQIPALVTSTAAGLLVTRVASEDEGAALGSELGSQLFGNAKALAASAAFVGLLAIVPGLPGVPFLVIGLVLLVLAQRRRAEERRARRDDTGAPRTKSRTGALAFVPVVAPWSVEIPRGLAPWIDDDRDAGDAADASDGAPSLRRRLHALREELFAELGLPLAAPRLQILDELPEGHAVVSVREVPQQLVSFPPPSASGPTADLATQAAAAIDAIAREASQVLQKRGHELLGIGETQQLLDALEQHNPALVRQLVPKPIPVPLLADVLRRLLDEQICVRDLRTILEGIAPLAVHEKDPLALAEEARRSLRYAITNQLIADDRKLHAYVVDPAIDDLVRAGITRTAAGTFVALAPRATHDLLTAVRAALDTAAPPAGARRILLAGSDVRRFLRRLIEHQHPDVIVTCPAELEPEAPIVAIARVTPR